MPSIQDDRYWSENSETALLSAMLLDEDARLAAMHELKPEAFYNFKNRTIFEAMCSLVVEDGGVDPVTLSDYLIERGSMEKVGGYERIAELVDFVANSDNHSAYIDNIRAKYTLRELLRACKQIEQQVEADPEMSTDMLIACAESAIFRLATDSDRIGEVMSARDLVMPTLDDISERMMNDSLPGVPTGFSRLDRMTGGMRPGQFVVIAGRPAMGKTSFAVNMAVRSALAHGTGVAIFSLEMGNKELMERMLAAEGRIDLNKIRNGKLDERDMVSLDNAAGLISEAPIYISDTMCQTPMEINAGLRRMMMKHDIGLVLIDYLQLMEAGDGTDNRVQEVSKISRRLKTMARALDVPIIALSQLSRKPEERENHRPLLSDLRESGSIEQDADIVMFMFREEFYGKINKKGQDVTGKAELIVGKQRNGPVGTITMDFHPEFTLFEERSSWNGN